MADQPRLPLGEIEIVCLNCGAPIIRPKKHAGRYPRFCSSECKRQRMRRQRAESYARLRTPKIDAVAVCLVCGEPFTRPANLRGRPPRICSEACRVIARRRRGARWYAKLKASQKGDTQSPLPLPATPEGGRVESLEPPGLGPPPILRAQDS